MTIPTGSPAYQEAFARAGTAPADYGWQTAGGDWVVRPVAPSPRAPEPVVAVAEAEHHVAFPGICRTRAGDLLIVYRHGKAHVDNEASIRMVRSTDGGHTWGPPSIIADAPEYDDRNSAISCLGDGTLVVCYDIYNLGEDRYSFFITSRDEGHTWSPPVRIGANPHFRTRSRALELTPTRWLFPVYDCSGPDEGQGSFALLYDVESGAWETGVITARHAGLDDETAVERAADGSLVAILRARGKDVPAWYHQSVSLDEGRTWSPAVPTALAGRHAPADLCRLADGRLVCAYSFLNRRSERLAVSRDNGCTWDIESSLPVRSGDPACPGDRAYASCTQVDEETLGTCLYETRAYPQGGRILFVRSAIAGFDRPGAPALVVNEPSPAALAFRPGAWREGVVSLRCRLTGRFGPDGGSVAVLSQVSGPDAYLAFSLEVAPRDAGRVMNRVALRLARPGSEPTTLAEGDAQGGWFDDGDEHVLTLCAGAGGTVRTAIDGVSQLDASVTGLPGGGLGVRVEDASAAVYEVTVRE